MTGWIASRKLRERRKARRRARRERLRERRAQATHRYDSAVSVAAIKLNAPRSRVRVRFAFGWRWLSGAILIVALLALYMLLDNSMFYVARAEVGGLRYISPEEVYALSGAANLHIFWVDPYEVAQAVAADPSIASAEVMVTWPARLIIRVQEREPALIWQQGTRWWWVDVNGNVMPLRRDMPELLRVAVETPQQEELHAGDTIPPDVVNGALQLHTLYPNIDLLFYDPDRGLSYQDGRGWRVYFGTGADMPRKLQVYLALVDSLLARGIQPEYIDVGNLDAPYYKLWD